MNRMIWNQYASLFALFLIGSVAVGQQSDVQLPVGMRQVLNKRLATQMEYRRHCENYGSRHPRSIQLKKELDFLDSQYKRVQDVVDLYRWVGSTDSDKQAIINRKETESLQLATKIKNTADLADRTELIQQLEAKIREAFQLRLELQQQQVKEVSESLQQAKLRLDQRKRDAEKVIQKRMRELIGESAAKLKETDPKTNKRVSQDPEVLALLEQSRAELRIALATLESKQQRQNDDHGHGGFTSKANNQWCLSSARNNFDPSARDVPLVWDVRPDRAKNLKWQAKLGSQSYGSPVVAAGNVYVGTNNDAGYVGRYPPSVDLGCLLAFDAEFGTFLWQHSSEKLTSGRVHDWPLQGLCSSALVEGDRLWIVTSRGEVKCLDTSGFYDNEDDGPVKNELVAIHAIANRRPTSEAYKLAIESLQSMKFPDFLRPTLADVGFKMSDNVSVANAGGGWIVQANVDGQVRDLEIANEGSRLVFRKRLSTADKLEADTVWAYDMMENLGVRQHHMAACSVTSHNDLLFICTGNALDAQRRLDTASPQNGDVPSFICLEKTTGKLIWSESSTHPIFHGHWASAAIGEIDGLTQAIFPGGDGYLYSFKADRGRDGKPELLWKFDCNPKTSVWKLGGEGTRNNIISAPVIHDGLVYIGVGQNPEHGEGNGHLWCIDGSKRGDISPELAVKKDGDVLKPIAQRRFQAVDQSKGEIAMSNPNSGVVWHYDKVDLNHDGEIDFEEEMHRTIGTVAIAENLLYVSDFSGLIHCLDAKGTKTGEPIVHFTYDMLAQSWGTPLIASGHVFFGDEDGDVSIFKLGAGHSEPIAEINMGSAVYTTPTVNDDTLYIANKSILFAIEKSDVEATTDKEFQERSDKLKRTRELLELIDNKIQSLKARDPLGN